MRTIIVTAMAVCFVSALRPAFAEPRVPESDSEIVERLPRGLGSVPRWKNGSSAPAATTARQYLKLAQKSGEPRYAHFAESILRGEKTTSLETRFLSGVLHEHLHRFDEARVAFEELLREDTNHAEALLQLAMLHVVQGRFAAARELLTRNTALLGSPNGLGVLAVVASLNGQLDASYSLLEKNSASFAESSEQGAWLKSALAEMAARLGRFDAAERHLNEARMLEPGAVPYLVQWADLLLAQGRFAETAALADHRPAHAALLLRSAIAMSRLPSQRERQDGLRGELQARLFDSTGPRHLREQALFTLHVLGEPGKALELALQNFASQREPIDARLILESALQAPAPDRVQPVITWLKETRLEDAAIFKLMKQLGYDS